MLKILFVVAGVIGTWFLLRRRQVDYPDAKTLIIQHEQDLSRRVLAIDGVANFRDLGGYRTTDGQRVRYGQVFRSGKLDGLTATGRAAAQSLGIRLICDMRSPEEVADAPDAIIDEDTRTEAFPLQTDDNRIAQVSAVLFNRAALRDLLPQLYTRVILDENAQTLGRIIERVAETDNRPILIHCTAGKDRTGVISALLLEILGVPDETIIADYTLSNLYYDNFYAVADAMFRRLSFLGMNASQAWPLLVAEADTMRTALAHIRTQYGSVTAYLQQQAGVSAETIQRLRADLLEPIPADDHAKPAQ